MKNYCLFLALCAFHPNTAFIAQRPGRLALSFKGWKTADVLSPTFSYTTDNDSDPSAATGPVKKFRDNSAPVVVQGGSLKTWSFASPSVDRVHVRLLTEGRPLDSDIELWQGPDNTPQKIRVYVEDGKARPFNCVMLTPRGPNTIAIRNTGQLEFPMTSYVSAEAEVDPFDLEKSETNAPKTIQGGALRTYPFDPTVESVLVLLKTDGRPLNAKIELLQGPNNNKQVVEVYTEDGNDRPFFVVIETPGSGNVVRVVNTATVEFPMTAVVEPYLVVSDKSSSEAVLGGDESRGNTRPFGRD